MPTGSGGGKSRGSVRRPCLKLHMGAKHLCLGPQLTSWTQNSNLQIMELEGATAPQREKLRSGVWSQNMVCRLQFGDVKLCPEPHMPPVDVSLGSTGVVRDPGKLSSAVWTH